MQKQIKKKGRRKDNQNTSTLGKKIEKAKINNK
jgi:hypothetical protein